MFRGTTKDTSPNNLIIKTLNKLNITHKFMNEFEKILLEEYQQYQQYQDNVNNMSKRKIKKIMHDKLKQLHNIDEPNLHIVLKRVHKDLNEIYCKFKNNIYYNHIQLSNQSYCSIYENYIELNEFDLVADSKEAILYEDRLYNYVKKLYINPNIISIMDILGITHLYDNDKEYKYDFETINEYFKTHNCVREYTYGSPKEFRSKLQKLNNICLSLASVYKIYTLKFSKVDKSYEIKRMYNNFNLEEFLTFKNFYNYNYRYNDDDYNAYSFHYDIIVVW